jgi:hypothetical protein
MKAETRRWTSKYSQCPESSETDGLKMSTEYLHSGAMDILRNSFLLHQYTVSSVSRGLGSGLEKHSLECYSCYVMAVWMAWMSAQRWPFNAPFIRANKKESQGDKSGEYGARDYTVIWCTDKNSLMDNAIPGRGLSCRRNHFPVDHDSERRRRIPSRKLCGTPWWLFWFTVWHRSGQIFLGLSAMHPVSELNGHMFCFLTQDQRQLFIACLSRKSDIWKILCFVDC